MAQKTILNIFKKKTSPKEALRSSKREMSVATRGIEREIASLQLEAMYASTAISTGMKGATKAMVAMNKVLDEIGVDIASQLSSAPKGRISSKKVENVVLARPGSTDVEDLEKRLASLRCI
ncbi:hypothetical protein IFM89_024954 [Coptis chinensis]|uniref:Uncharacterized protein n=1 Tax=Coptis chinensis TaxID=261450 RepID=A0A835IPN6_9MAGN|nr:hypothetical protein IFM89_024954 [Coptis chinensis]